MKKTNKHRIAILLSCAALTFFPIAGQAQDDLLDDPYQDEIVFEEFEDVEDITDDKDAVYLDDGVRVSDNENMAPVFDENDPDFDKKVRMERRSAPRKTDMSDNMKEEIDSLTMKIMKSKQQVSTLRDALGYGLYTNPEYGVVANNRRATDEELRQAQALYLPSIDLRADAGYEISNDPTTRARGEKNVEDTRYDSSITLTQLLFDGFETKYENVRQKHRVLSASHRVREVSEFVGLDIIEAYLDVIRQRELLSISRDNVAEHVRILDQIEESAEAGRTTEANVEQVKARLASARAQESRVRESLRIAESVYIAEVGMMPGELVLPVTPYDALTASVEDEVRRGLAHSPTLDVFEADIDVAQAEYEGSKSTYYPSFDLQLNARSADDVGAVDGRDKSATALVVANWNLYRGGGDSARVREQIKRVAQVKDERAEAARDLENEIRQTWASMVAAGERVRDFSVQAEANGKVVEAYKDQFDLNRRTLLDVLDAQNEHFVSQSNVIDSEFLEMFAVYRLLALRGEVLSTLDVQKPRESDPNVSPVYSTELETDRDYNKF